MVMQMKPYHLRSRMKGICLAQARIRSRKKKAGRRS